MAKSLRVLWLSHFLPFPPKGGALQRSYHLLREMAARHELHLVSLNQRALLGTQPAIDEAVRSLSPLVGSLHWFPMECDPGTAEWLWLLLRTFVRADPYDVTWLENRRMAAQLAEQAKAHFDLVHIDTIGLWPYRRLTTRIPVLLNHHNVESQLMARRASVERRWARRAFFSREAQKLRRLERVACLASTLNIAVSPLDAERLTQVAAGARFRVVENGVDVEYFRPNDRPTDPGSLVFVGGLDWYPNRDAVAHFLSDIWPRVVIFRPDASVTFVGRDPPDSLTRARDPRVKFTGFVPDVRPFIDAAEVYVCPMRDGGGTRLKILDALASGKALVSTAVGVEGIDVKDGLHYLAAETPEEFAAAIDVLQRDRDLRRRLGHNGRRLVEERYGWQRIGAALNDAYLETVETCKAAPQ